MCAVCGVRVVLDGRPTVDACICKFLCAMAILAFYSHRPSVRNGVGGILYRDVVAVCVFKTGVRNEDGEVVAGLDTSNLCLGHQLFQLLHCCRHTFGVERRVIRLIVGHRRVIKGL